MAGNSACSECGMANVADEFHPYALCLLVKARGGDTAAARKDMAAIIDSARSADPWTERRVTTFLVNQHREEKNSRGR